MTQKTSNQARDIAEIEAEILRHVAADMGQPQPSGNAWRMSDDEVRALIQETHDNSMYGRNHNGWEMSLVRAGYRAALAAQAQPAICGYTCTVPDDCETLHWRGQILSMNELASVAQPAVGEEIHIHIEGQDVLTLPLASSGMNAPRFVVHVPAQAQPVSGADGLPSRQQLRDLVDAAWKEATESDAVPDTPWADRIIDGLFPARPLPSGDAGGVPGNNLPDQVADGDADMYWNAEDPEQFASRDLLGAVEYMMDDYRPSDLPMTIELMRARSLPNVEVLVTAYSDEDGWQYQVKEVEKQVKPE